MAASFPTFLSDWLPGRGRARADVDESQPFCGRTSAPQPNHQLEDDEPRSKRRRIDQTASAGPAVISLLSEDEEGGGGSGSPVRHTGQPRILSPHFSMDELDAYLNIHCSGTVIPPGRGQDLGAAERTPGPIIGSHGLNRHGHGHGHVEGGLGWGPHPGQQAWAPTPAPSIVIPDTYLVSTGPEPRPTSQSQEPPRIRAPIKEPPLCPEQAELVDIILSGRNVFYTGSAGCGKSTVLKAFTKRLADRGKRVDIVAPTGISALGVGGSTTFVYAGWNLSSFKLSLDKLRRGAHAKHVRKRLKDTDVLVIDEISMVENFHFERLNAVMQEARSSYEPFGGAQVVVTGDFHQLPPVKPFQYCLQCGDELEANRSEESYACKKHGIFHDEDKWAFKSKTWALCNFVYFHLRTIHRQNDETFIKILQKCRIGQPLTGEDTDLLMNHPCRIGNATKLYARREEVRRENRIRFDKLVSEKYSFPCMDEINMNPDHHHLERYTRRSHDGSLESLKDHRYETLVEFKRGMLVVLLTNLDLGRKLCNGSQGIICGYEEFDPQKLPKVATKKDPSPENSIHGDYAEMREMYVRTFMDRKTVAKKVWPIVKFHNGEVRTIYADCSVHTLGNKAPYSLLSRTQIPLAAAWAMSIHKSQSLTLDRVIVDLTRAWEEGQVYVALSRATSLTGLKIEGDPRGLAVGKGGNTEVRKFHKEKFGI